MVVGSGESLPAWLGDLSPLEISVKRSRLGLPRNRSDVGKGHREQTPRVESLNSRQTKRLLTFGVQAVPDP